MDEIHFKLKARNIYCDWHTLCKLSKGTMDQTDFAMFISKVFWTNYIYDCYHHRLVECHQYVRKLLSIQFPMQWKSYQFQIFAFLEHDDMENFPVFFRSEGSLLWRHNERDGVSNHQITYSTVYSGTDQRKHQSFASLAFVRIIQRWPVNSPLKLPVTRKMFPIDDVIMVGGVIRRLSVDSPQGLSLSRTCGWLISNAMLVMWCHC